MFQYFYLFIELNWTFLLQKTTKQAGILIKSKVILYSIQIISWKKIKGNEKWENKIKDSCTSDSHTWFVQKEPERSHSFVNERTAEYTDNLIIQW